MARAIDPVLVIGSGGMLGRAFCALLAREGVRFDALDLPQIDLANPESIERSVTREYTSVINCAAFTEVDAAETREAEADAVNATGVGALAARCRTLAATLVHFSTDYVFDGAARVPYRVDHPRAPINAYGRGKARGEELLESSGAEHLLIRTSWLYAPWGKNFVLTMRELLRSRPTIRVVSDQLGRPTSATYLALRSLGLLRRGCRGRFHVTDGGECSWFEFASEINRVIGAARAVEPCTTAEFPRPAPRPAYSVLDLERVEAELGPSRSWRENLADVLRAI